MARPTPAEDAMESWIKEIEKARTEDEVVASARDFCSLLHPRELAPLPAALRTVRIEGESDIRRLRDTLSAGCAAVHDPRAETQKLRALVDYLSRADQRLGEIRASD
jgi:hypothetical protein